MKASRTSPPRRRHAALRIRLGKEDLAGLTVFTQNNWEMYNSDNFHVLRPKLNDYLSRTAYNAAQSGDVKVAMTTSYFNNKVYSYLTDVMQKGDGLTTIGTAPGILRQRLYLLQE